AELGVPSERVDVEQQRSRRVRVVGHRAAAELEREPRVDRSEANAPFPGTLAETGDVLEQPLDLRPGEVRVDHEPRPLADELFAPGRPQLVAALGGAAVLPHDRAVERLARALVPADDGLALVRDPDRLQVAGVDAGCFERLPSDASRDLPDLVGVVLDPARPREVLLQ